MNRVLNVTLVFGLACTLACAPGSRHQTGAKAPGGNDSNAKPKPTPVPTAGVPPVSVVSTPQVVTDTSTKQNANFDITTATLANAQVISDLNAGTVKLVVSAKDSKNNPQDSWVLVDSKGSTTQDSKVTNVKYVCSDNSSSNTNPATCTDAEISYTYGSKSADAKITLAANRPVSETLDKAASTQFGTALVQNLNFTLDGSPTFSRTNALIVATGASYSDNSDDKELSQDGSNISIMVNGLSKELTSKNIRPVAAVTLNAKSGRAATGSMTAKTDKENQLIYTLGVIPVSTTVPVQTLTLTISMPLATPVVADDENKDDSAPAAAASTATAAPATTGSTAAPGTNTAAEPGAAPASSAAAAAALAAVPKPANPIRIPSGPRVKTADIPPPQVKFPISSQLPFQIPSPAVLNPELALSEKDFCEFNATVKGSLVKARIDIVANQASIVLADDMLKASTPWQSNYCDSSTGRLAERYDAPGARACASRWIKDNYTETVVFNVDPKNKNSCSAKLTQYVPGQKDLEGSGTGCYVRPIDGMSLHVSNALNSDGYQAHWAHASNLQPNDAPFMYPMGGPKFEIHDNNGVKWDIFYNPALPDQDKDKCWGRAQADVPLSKTLTLNQ